MNKYILSNITNYFVDDLLSINIFYGSLNLYRFHSKKPHTSLAHGQFLDLRRSDIIGLLLDNDVFDAIEGSCFPIVKLLLNRLINILQSSFDSSSLLVRFSVKIELIKLRKTCLEYASEPDFNRPEIKAYLIKRLKKEIN